MIDIQCIMANEEFCSFPDGWSTESIMYHLKLHCLHENFFHGAQKDDYDVSGD